MLIKLIRCSMISWWSTGHPPIAPGTKMVELVFKTLRPWVLWHWLPLGTETRGG